MRLALLAPAKFAETTRRLYEHAKKKFRVKLIPLNEVVVEVGKEFGVYWNEESLLDFDYVLPRIDAPRARFGYHVIKALDLFQVRKPYDAEALRIAHNKFATVFELAKNNIPVPLSFYVASKKGAKVAIENLSMPIVIKLISSFGGEGVLFLNTETSALSVAKTLNLLREDMLIEEFVENPGEDIRAFVIGDEMIGMKRIAKHDFRANVHLGGKAMKHELSGEEEKIARKCAKAVGSKILAVDMIESEDGPKVIEVNINPGVVGISEATGIDVAERIIEFVYQEAKK